MTTQNPNEVLAAWETSAQYWSKYQHLVEMMFAPMSRVLIEEAGIGPGQSVLDVGGGSGEPSLTIAAMVGELGSVSYTDPASGMVKAASAEATRRGCSNILFQQSGVEKLPFTDGSFDVVVSRLSAMFFADALGGLQEMLRVAKPGGCVALLVWSGRQTNPFFTAVSDVLDRFITPEPESEDAPTAFRFAAPGKLAKLLKKAGGHAVTERTFQFPIEAPIDVDQFWLLRTEMSDSFRKKLAALVPDQVAAIKYAVQKNVARYFKSGSMSFPGEVLIVTGSKSS
jgi:SAM-dependent methyltransferase